MSQPDLSVSHAVLKDEAARLAGGLSDLSQRATVYHHLFQASHKHVAR